MKSSRILAVIVVALGMVLFGVMESRAGEIVGWGENSNDQATPPDGSDYIAITAGHSHSLGLKKDGSIVAWGDNRIGQCYIPSPNADFIAVATGMFDPPLTFHSLGLKKDGSITAWGDNTYQQCDVPYPNADFIAIAAGGAHSLGLKKDGSIVAWGWNDYDQCNIPSPNANFIAIAAGKLHSLGLKKDGSIVVWGDNSLRQCDIPSPNADFIAVAAGLHHSLGLKADGSIVAWGDNRYEQSTIPDGNDFVAIVAGGYHNLALKADGSIVAWGRNNYYQCSIPSPNTGFIAVAAGVWHSLALKAVPMGTAFIYQGRLINVNEAADGLHDFKFTLYNNMIGGMQQADTIDVNGLDVIDGYFTAELDFGSGIFDGNELWLEIGVQSSDSNDINDFAILSPRQQLTPTPYTVYANTAGYSEIAGYAETAGNIPDGIIGSGTENYIAKFMDTNTIGDSDIYEYAGNVGIGTTNPEHKLHIKKPSPTEHFQLKIANPNGAQDSNGHAGILFQVENDQVGRGKAGILFESIGNWNRGKFHFLQNDEADDSQVSLADSVMTIQNDGRVGIGTTSPKRQLSVIGPIRSSRHSGETEHVEIHHGGSNGIIKWVGDGNLDFRYGDTTLVSITQTGEAGIGTTDPCSRLHVASPSSYYGMLTLENSNTGDNEATIAFKEGSDANGNETWLAGVSPWGLTNDFVIGRQQPLFVLSQDGDVNIMEGNLLIRGPDGFNFNDEEGVLYLGNAPHHYLKAVYGFGLKIGTFGAEDAISIRQYTGNVGIGTTDPKEKLEVDGTVKAAAFVGDGSGITNISPTSDTDWIDADGNVYRETGNVGIGTTNPIQKLSVIGPIRSSFEPNEAEHVQIGHGGANGYINWVGDGNLDFRYQNSTLVSIDDAGNVGVGTPPNPGTKLDVASSNTAAAAIGAAETSAVGIHAIALGAKAYATDNYTIAMGTNTTSGGWYSTAIGTDITVSGRRSVGIGVGSSNANISANNVMAVMGGNVGIGTTSPQNKLDVEGAIAVGSTYSGTNTAPENGMIVEGQVGIGTTNLSSLHMLAVNGWAAKPGGGSWETFSDIRLKEIRDNYKCGLAEISKLQPVYYRYKEDNAEGLPSDRESVGIVAQEVQKVIPDTVNENDNGYLMVNNDPIIWAMVNAIKELKAQNQELKQKLEALEKTMKKTRFSATR